MPVSELLCEPPAADCHGNRGVKDTRGKKLYLVCVACGGLCVCVCGGGVGGGGVSVNFPCRQHNGSSLQSHIEMTLIKQII